MLDFSQFEVLTFDCYGTLINWEQGILTALRPVFEMHAISINDQQILEAFAAAESQAEADSYLTYREILKSVMAALGKRYNFSPPESDMNSIAESIQHWPPFPDTVAALRKLQSRYKLGILSNIDDDLFAGSARHLEIDFDWIITAQQLGSYKPSLSNFRAAIERIGLEKNQILHVAQSLFHDIAPAREVGLHTVWVNRRKGESGFGATPPSSAAPDLETASLQELAERMGL